MLGRGTNLLRPLRARLPFRCMPLSSRHYDLAIRPLIPSAHRCFAEAVRKPGRPKKAVGEPSRPVKRAVKRAAKAPADAEAATKQVKAKKAAAEKKAAKPKPKAQAKPKKKEPTEAQLAAKKKRLVSAELKELKQAALHPPRRTKIGARSEWLRDFYTAPAQVEPRPTDHDHAAIKAWFADASRRAVEEWRHVTPEQLEHYNHKRVERRKEEEAAYKAWVESHTPETIAIANRARAQLRKRVEGIKGHPKYPAIEDPRQVKRPVSPFATFTTNRHASGDLKGIPVPQSAKLVGQEWKDLNESDKQKYQKLYTEDKHRYIDDYTRTYGKAPQVATA